MAELKDRLRADLNAAMRARDQVRMRTLRMALTSITNEEVAGAAARDLSDEEIVRVLTREAKKRREAAEAFAAANRVDQAAAERAEGEVLAGYLPAQLSDDDLAALVAAAITETGASGMPGMGQVMRVVTPRVAGRADGARVAAEVRRQLTAGLTDRYSAASAWSDVGIPSPSGPEAAGTGSSGRGRRRYRRLRTSAVASLVLGRLRLHDDLSVALDVERAVGGNGDEVGDLPEVGVVERHVPGRRGRVGAEHLAGTGQAPELQPVAAARPAHGVVDGRRDRIEHRDIAQPGWACTPAKAAYGVP